MQHIKEIDKKFSEKWEKINKNEKDFVKAINELRGNDKLSTKNVISIDELSKEDISLIFRMAWPFKDRFLVTETKKIPILKGKCVINFFFETSTRTRTSFEVAGKHLGADTINISGSGSSMSKKKETLKDTAQTLNALKADCIILRHSRAGTPYLIAEELDCPVINGGDGCHEHPTQALLDAFTICNNLGTVNGKTITIIGDILHSRVAGSLIRILKKMNGNVRVCGPETLLPEAVEEVFGVEKFYDVEKALKGTDVIYALRPQLERAAAAFIPTVREYSKNFGISKKRVEIANTDAIVMHPGPINREVDVHSDVADGPQSRILEQVTNGFCIRMALLDLLINGQPGGRN